MGGGAYAFLQVIPGVNGTATTEQILDAVLSSKGKFGAYGEPADVRVIQDKELAGGDRQLVLLFTSYSPQSAEFQNRAIVRSTTVDGDAFVLVGMACCSRGAVRVRGSPVSSLGPGVGGGGGGLGVGRKSLLTVCIYCVHVCRDTGAKPACMTVSCKRARGVDAAITKPLHAIEHGEEDGEGPCRARKTDTGTCLRR
ncbi:slc44a2 [Symbiodinium necroappetens]|uniref:Slc44a2 protein n=1 Tax=Symbiodinium necroappetens TaxID=1628268 RepID=A0A813C9C9_9DINO|nr:slc44a2 [Symbiodinium necroappetens]